MRLKIWALAALMIPMGLTATDAPSLQGQSAPAFELKDLKGKVHSSAEFKGKPTVVMFMTSWCPFSKAMGPNVEKLYKAYKLKGVQVVVVNLKEGHTQAAVMAAHHHFTCPVLLDEDGSVASSFAPKDAQPDIPRDQVVISSNLIIGADGKIAYQTLLDTDNFDAKLVKLRAKIDEILAMK